MKSILVEASGPLPRALGARCPLQASASATVTTFHTPWSSRPIGHLRNTLAILPLYHRREHRIHPALRSSCLTHRHGTQGHAASHQPRAAEPFGGLLARTELQFLPKELPRVRVVCASMSQTAACNSSSLSCCYIIRGAIAVLLQARHHCH